MEYFGIIPERKLWIKIAAIILAIYSVYHAYANNNWFYLPFGIILLLATFSKRRHKISKEGVDIEYILLGHIFHNLWQWEEILAVHTDSIKSTPNIEFHINKGAINRRFIFSKKETIKVIAFIEDIKRDIKIVEVNHNKKRKC